MKPIGKNACKFPMMLASSCPTSSECTAKASNQLDPPFDLYYKLQAQNFCKVIVDVGEAPNQLSSHDRNRERVLQGFLGRERAGTTTIGN